VPITNAVLSNESNAHIYLKASSTLMDAFAALKAASGEPAWHLIIAQGPQHWGAVKFSELDALAVKMGPDFFTTPIDQLPLPLVQAKAVEQASMDDGDAGIEAYLSPGQLLVVTWDGAFVGILYAGGARGGDDLFAGPAAIELHGVLADLSQDARVRYTAKAPPPTCRHCGQPSYLGYDLARGVFFCQNCLATVE
jgi:hypothetical protein